MKRFLSILLALVMIISVATPVFAYTDTEDSDYAKAIENLSGLGVINGYEDGTFKPEKVVTRAEMAKLLVICLGLDIGASLLEGATTFNDVPTSHWANGYINVASQYGLIKGDGDGNFRPDDPVNYAEACTMILRALGYDRVVDKAGQWPTNYLNKANELKIFDNVEKFIGTDGANRGAIAQMMWNMLNTPMWEATEESESNGLNYTKGETMLVNKFPDFVTKDGDDMVPNYVEEAEILAIEVINSTTVDVTFETNGKVGLQDDEDKEVRFENISPLEFVKGIKYDVLYTVEKIDGANVYVAKSLYEDNTNVVFGYITKATEEEVTINDKEYEEANNELSANDEGYVAIIELDKNGEVVRIGKYASEKAIVIEEVKESKDGKTTNYNTYKNGNGKITVDNTDKDNMFVKYNTDGTSEIVKQADIKAGMVIEEYTNGSLSGLTATNEKGNIYVVSEKSMSGNVSKIKGTNINKAIITVDNIDYRINAKALLLLSSNTEPDKLTFETVKGLIGEEIETKLNNSNEIMYIEAEDSVIAKNYGFITKAWKETVEGNEIYKVRIMDLDGTVKDYITYNFEDKESEKLDCVSDPLADADIGKFIQYELKDNKIIQADKVNYSGKANTPIVAKGVDDKNETAATFKYDGETIAWNSNTKGYRYEVNAEEYKVNIKSFDIADMENGNYIVVVDKTTNVAEFVLSNNLVTTDKVYGVVVEESSISGKDENDDTLYSTTIYDIATNELVELEVGTDKTTYKVGTVVSYEEGTDKYFDLENEDTLGSVKEGFIEPRNIGNNKEIETESSGKILVTGNVEVLFINENATNSDDIVDDSMELDDITEFDLVYGVSTVEKVNSTDEDIYDVIIIKSIATITNTDLTSYIILPVRGETPDTTKIDDAQYTGTITWKETATGDAVASNFEASTGYTATVTITPKGGYTLQGITENSFEVTTANSATNAANSGIVTVVWPITGA